MSTKSKELVKLEKKSLKANQKAEKKQMASSESVKSRDHQWPKHSELKAPTAQQMEIVVKQESLPWHKDPNWIRAIIALATMVIAILTLYFTIFY
ncbi:MAG: hypothetical protein Q7J68_01560 [Thermoplasmata archaeon]|nr:hypothetical protein [Thermoplasmata archaeon]